MRKITPFTYTRTMWTGANGHKFKFRRRCEPMLTIGITSFAGVGIGASHYYGRVKAHGLELYNCTEKQWCHSDFYIYGIPILQKLSLTAERVLHKVEKDMQGEILGWIGNTTSRFNEPDEVLTACLKLTTDTFKDSPTKHWDIFIEGAGYAFEDPLRLSELENIDSILREADWGL